MCDRADGAATVGRIAHGALKVRPTGDQTLTADNGPGRKRLGNLRLHLFQQRTTHMRIGQQGPDGVLAVTVNILRQRNTRMRPRPGPFQRLHRVGDDVLHRRLVIGQTMDEGTVGAVLQQAAHEIGQQILMAAHRRINAQRHPRPDAAFQHFVV